MAQRSSSMGGRDALGNLLRLEGITGTDDEIAGIHETNRQSTVKEILVHVFFLSRFGHLEPAMAAQAAHSQYFYATGTDQAAHCVPGQLIYNGQPIQKLITTNDGLELSLENLFGRTDGIHSKFNKADSRAEENGLRMAFGDAANQVARQGKRFRFEDVEQIFPVIEQAFIMYKGRGIGAYSAAIARQQSITTSLQGVTRAELISILTAYRDKLNTAMNSVDSVQGIIIEADRLWREYRFL